MRVRDDGVEDRLDIGGRSRDDAQDLGEGRLLLECLGEAALEGRVFSWGSRPSPDGMAAWLCRPGLRTPARRLLLALHR
jgi:hypothetical protein